MLEFEWPVQACAMHLVGAFTPPCPEDDWARLLALRHRGATGTWFGTGTDLLTKKTAFGIGLRVLGCMLHIYIYMYILSRICEPCCCTVVTLDLLRFLVLASYWVQQHVHTNFGTEPQSQLLRSHRLGQGSKVGVNNGDQ